MVESYSQAAIDSWLSGVAGYKSLNLLAVDFGHDWVTSRTADYHQFNKDTPTALTFPTVSAVSTASITIRSGFTCINNNTDIRFGGTFILVPISKCDKLYMVNFYLWLITVSMLALLAQLRQAGMASRRCSTVYATDDS